jgi:hypothetical protein
MKEQSPEDSFIRNLVLIATTGVAVGLLVVATVITVLVSANFNVLNWME